MLHYDRAGNILAVGNKIAYCGRRGSSVWLTLRTMVRLGENGKIKVQGVNRHTG